MKKSEELQQQITVKIEEIDILCKKIKGIYPDNKKLPTPYYIWLLYSYDILLQARDLVAIGISHDDVVEKSKNGLYMLLRSILEDYCYLKLLLRDKKDIQLHLNANIINTEKNSKKNLNSLVGLHKRGKYIPTKDPTLVTSLPGLSKKIAELDSDIETILNGAGSDKNKLIDLTNIYSDVINVCREFDSQSGISSVEAGNESKSLEWLYGYVYRFSSGYVHQSLRSKEMAMDVLYYQVNPSPENEEVWSLLAYILGEVIVLQEGINSPSIT